MIENDEPTNAQDVVLDFYFRRNENFLFQMRCQRKTNRNIFIVQTFRFNIRKEFFVRI